MNDIINKFLLTEDKFMPEMHLKQPGFTYSACGPFTKNEETGDTNYIYRNDLDKACFQHDMAYTKYKDLTKRIQYVRIQNEYNKYDGYQRGLASMVYKFF